MGCLQRDHTIHIERLWERWNTGITLQHNWSARFTHFNKIITHADWLTEWVTLRACPYSKQKVQACSKHSSFSQCMDIVLPFSVRERERERERKREGRRERERERKREGERERCIIFFIPYLFLFLTGMTGALAPFSCLVTYKNTNCCSFKTL